MACLKKMNPYNQGNMVLVICDNAFLISLLLSKQFPFFLHCLVNFFLRPSLNQCLQWQLLNVLGVHIKIRSVKKNFCSQLSYSSPLALWEKGACSNHFCAPCRQSSVLPTADNYFSVMFIRRARSAYVHLPLPWCFHTLSVCNQRARQKQNWV